MYVLKAPLPLSTVAQGDTKARRVENMYCKSECDMLQLTADDLTQMCEHYPQVCSRPHTRCFAVHPAFRSHSWRIVPHI